METVDAMGTLVTVSCPHCFEALEVLIEAESRGSWVQDCEVCCNPWQVTVLGRSGGVPEVSVETL